MWEGYLVSGRKGKPFRYEEPGDSMEGYLVSGRKGKPFRLEFGP